MRVTDAARFDQVRRELDRTTGQVARQSEHLSTGRRLNRLSDDPELAVQADRLLAEDKALAAYTEAAENARAWLAAQDGALQTATSVLRRARELTIAAGSPQGSSGREGIAVELEGLRQQLIEVANTTFNGRAVFAGFADRTVSESGGVVTFVGDDGSVQRRVGEDHVVRINVSGADAFGFTAGDDVFALLAEIADHVRSGDAAAISTTDLSRLSDTATRMQEALGTVGARSNQVITASDVGTVRRDQIRAHRGSIVDADLAETALELTLAETAYEAVLAATARLQRPTLVDYLR